VIWALLAFLGIPIWFIGVILIAVFRNRRKVLARPDIFRFVEPKDDGWSRSAGVARWVSDVLIVHKGPALIGTDAQRVVSVDLGERIDEPIKKLDGDAVEMLWTFEESEAKRVAVERSQVDVARG
jgi:hypothetical protein